MGKIFRSDPDKSCGPLMGETGLRHWQTPTLNLGTRTKIADNIRIPRLSGSRSCWGKKLPNGPGSQISYGQTSPAWGPLRSVWNSVQHPTRYGVNTHVDCPLMRLLGEPISHVVTRTPGRGLGSRTSTRPSCPPHLDLNWEARWPLQMAESRSSCWFIWAQRLG